VSDANWYSRPATVAGLAVLNLAVVVGVASLWPEPEPASAPPVAAQAAPEPTFSWANRFAPGADDDPLCTDCNVIMVSLDIFRPDHMPCMGYSAPTAPNICDMVDNGVTFDNFIVHAYQTPVSQMSIFTGKYPSSSGFTSFTSQLPTDTPYLPEALQAAGYNTVAIGSSFEVMSDMSTAAPGKKPKFKRTDLNPGMSFGRGFNRFVFTGNRNVPTDAIPWIQQNKDDKFFLWMILGSLHWPYGRQADPRHVDRFDPPGYEGPLLDWPRLGFRLLSRIHNLSLYEDDGSSVPLDAQDAAYINARYDVGLWTVDQFIGDLVRAIPEETLKKTVILLHGVHGEDLGEHGYFGHYDIFDTEVKSTLVVLNPRHAAKGVRIQEQIEAVDMTPTLLEMLGLDAFSGVDGQSVMPVLKAGKGDPERITYFERIPLWEDIFRHRSKMPREFVEMVKPYLDRTHVGDTGLRTSRFKLIHRTARDIENKVSWWAWLTREPLERVEWELYDLAADPTEQTNVINDHPKVAKRLKKKLLAWEAKHKGKR